MNHHSDRWEPIESEPGCSVGYVDWKTDRPFVYITSENRRKGYASTFIQKKLAIGEMKTLTYDSQYSDFTNCLLKNGYQVLACDGTEITMVHA